MRRFAFTVLELLIVCSIIILLCAVVFPVAMQAKRNALRTPCIANMRQLHVAMDMYCENEGGWENPPPHLTYLFDYVSSPKLYVCPADRFVRRQPKGWPVILGIRWDDPDQLYSENHLSYSYLRDYSPSERREIWDHFSKTHPVGVLACPWHGSTIDSLPSPYSEVFSPPMRGPILRICFDGSLYVWRKTGDMLWSTGDMFYYPVLLKEEP